MTDSERLTASECRRCQMKLDAATGVDEADRPTPGSVSICWYCGTVSLFADDLTLREPTIEEVDDIIADEHVGFILARLWDYRFARLVALADGVEFRCGCRTSAGGGLFALEACAENCATARTIMKMADDEGKPLAVIR